MGGSTPAASYQNDVGTGVNSRPFGIPPLVTIIGLLVGFELFGILGAVLAVPVAAALGILIPEVAAALVAPTPLSDAGEASAGDVPREEPMEPPITRDLDPTR